MGSATYTKCKYVDKHGTEEQKKSLIQGKASLDNIYKKISEEYALEAQDGRRNITQFKYTEKEIRRNFLKERNEAKKRQGARNDLKTSIKTEGQGARVDLLPKDLKGLNNIALNSARSDEDRSDRTNYKLAEKAGVGHDTIHKTRYVMEKADKDFVDERDVKFWIRLNQLAGRNMNEGEKVYQVSLLKADFEALAKEGQGKRNDLLEKYEDYIKNFWQESASNEEKDKQKSWDDNRVNAKLGKIAGVSRDTISKFEAIKKIGSVKDILEIREGKKKINPTYDNLRRMHRVEEAKKEFPGEDYEVVYANLYEIDKNSPNCFKLSRTIEKINSIPVKEFTACQALAFLWSPINFVDRTIDIMKTWGFKYQTGIYFEPNDYIGIENKYSSLGHGLLIVGSKNGYFPLVSIVSDYGCGAGFIDHLVDDVIAQISYRRSDKPKVISISPLEGKNSEWDQYQEEKVS